MKTREVEAANDPNFKMRHEGGGLTRPTFMVTSSLYNSVLAKYIMEYFCTETVNQDRNRQRGIPAIIRHKPTFGTR